MTYEDNDPTLHRLRHLAVLEPDPTRSERVRMRCRAALAERQLRREHPIASNRITGLALESGLTYGLSVGYLLAVIGDVLRVYMRR